MSAQKQRTSRRLRARKVTEFNLAKEIFSPSLPKPKRKTSSSIRALSITGQTFSTPPATAGPTVTNKSESASESTQPIPMGNSSVSRLGHRLGENRRFSFTS